MKSLFFFSDSKREKKTIMFLVLLSAVLSLRARRPSSRVYGEKCDSCAFVSRIIMSLVNKSASEEIIRARIQKQCHAMRSPDGRRVCYEISNENLSRFIELAKTNVTEMDLCIKTSFCNVTDKLVYKNFKSACSVCSYVVETIETALNSTTVEEEIAAVVSLACSVIPTPGNVICSGIIDKFLPYIMKLLEEGMEAADICKRIGLCSTRLSDGDLSLTKATRLLRGISSRRM